MQKKKKKKKPRNDRRKIQINSLKKLDMTVRHLVNYQHEVDMGKLTAMANFEKLMFQALSKGSCSEKGLCSKCQLFKICYQYEYGG